MTTRTRSACFTFTDREMPVRFGRYHLLRRIASDPVGEDFLAAWGVDEGVDQLRVVRCIFPSVAAEAEFVSLFSEEARTLSRLSSANVVRIMEVGLQGEIPFVTREHVEGVTLSRLIELAIKRTSLWPWELAAHVFSEVLRGLDYVHRREDLHGRPMGMRHGDVRPANVLVSFNGEVKLSNFGSTLRFIVDEKTAARLSELRGRYLPPEGVDELEPSVAADLWGASVVLLMLLGGKPPSKRTTDQGLPWNPPQMSFRVEDMPEVMDTFIARALNPDPSFRFQTAAQMRAALLDILSEHASGHAPDDLSMWMRDLADSDRREEAELVRKLLGREASMTLDDAAEVEGALGPGKVLDGRYHLHRRLGEGGMGVVFEAEHLGLGRRVAVKVLHERVLDDSNTVERFRREAQIIGGLGHPNIVGAHDFGISPDGYHFLAMDLLEGTSLSERMEKRDLSARELVVAMAQVCDGLAAAHEAGVIHRDLKPDNIYLTPTGARILDFGIAKTTGLDEKAEALTRTGHICGTVDYIAPEQIRGLSQDPRSDIYAAGVIIYEALTGETPYHGRTVGETLHKAMNDKLVPPRKRSGDKTIPPDLEALCVKALNRKAEKRFSSARELGDALRALLPPEGETASMGALSSRRSKIPLMVGGGALVLLALAAAWFLLGREDIDSDGGKEKGIVSDENLPGEGRPAAAPRDAGPMVVRVEEEEEEWAEPAPESESEKSPASAPEEGERAVEPEDGDEAEAKERSARKVEEGEAALARMGMAAATAAFEEAVRLDSRNSRAWYGLGKIAFQTGDYQTAIDKTERALRYSPGSRSRRIFLGKIYLAAGRNDDAINQWKRVLEVDPDNQKVKDLIDRASGG